MTAEVVLDPASIPALLSKSLDVPRGEAVRGADLLERLRSRLAVFGTGGPFAGLRPACHAFDSRMRSRRRRVFVTKRRAKVFNIAHLKRLEEIC
jgi:hypothetical protein